MQVVRLAPKRLARCPHDPIERRRQERPTEPSPADRIVPSEGDPHEPRPSRLRCRRAPGRLSSCGGDSRGRMPPTTTPKKKHARWLDRAQEIKRAQPKETILAKARKCKGDGPVYPVRVSHSGSISQL